MSTEPEIDLDDLNHTELVTLMHWLGMENVTRAVPRDMILEALEELQTIDIPNPVDEKRRIVSKWLTRHWDRLAMQVRKSECPDCFLCSDMQVVECFNDNKHHFNK